MERGWKPILVSDGCPISYHDMLHAELGHEPETLIELEALCCTDKHDCNRASWAKISI